jgi:hypothetical protein
LNTSKDFQKITKLKCYYGNKISYLEAECRKKQWDRKQKSDELCSYSHNQNNKEESFQGNLLVSKPLTLRSNKEVKKDIVCFICNKKGHIPKNCPNKKKKEEKRGKSLQMHNVVLWDIYQIY